MSRKILITGGTGFIGQPLCHALREKDYDLTVFSRQSSTAVRTLCGRVDTVASLDELKGQAGFHGVINLAGEGIADRRWSERRKGVLKASRIDLTNHLVEVIRSWQSKPEVMVSGSAVGYYGDQGSAVVTEQTKPHDEFSHQLCRDWEQAALALEADQVRVCLSRTGLVAGPGGGFLKRMLLPFRLGLGGHLGSGQQYMPWVHRDDMVSALIWMLENESARGAYNVVSPNPVTNREFSAALGRILHRPVLLPAPAFALRLALGEMSRLLLTGQNARPERLLSAGFEFRYPQLEPALGTCLT